MVIILDIETYVDKKGYVRFCDSHELVHRWIVQNHLGRKLKRTEVVHHLNGNKLDNDISNLMVFQSQYEHYHWHLDQKLASGVW